MQLTNNFSTTAFADGAFWSLVDAARAADTILMDGIVPALRAIDRAIGQSVNWANKWVTPLVIVSAQIALVIWEDLICWTADRYVEKHLKPTTPEIKLLPPAPAIEPPAEPAPIPVVRAQAAIAAPVATLTIEIESEEVSESPDALMDLEEMTLAQLKALAKGRVPGFSKMTKATLIDRLRA